MNAEILAALNHMDMAVKHYEDAKELLEKHGIKVADYTYKLITVYKGIDILSDEIGEEAVVSYESTPCKTVTHNGIEYFQYAKPTQEYTWN